MTKSPISNDAGENDDGDDDAAGDAAAADAVVVVVDDDDDGNGDGGAWSATGTATLAVWKVRTIPWASRNLAVKCKLTTVANGAAAAAPLPPPPTPAAAAALPPPPAHSKFSFHSRFLAAWSSNENLTMRNKIEIRLQQWGWLVVLFDITSACEGVNSLLNAANNHIVWVVTFEMVLDEATHPAKCERTRRQRAS